MTAFLRKNYQISCQSIEFVWLKVLVFICSSVDFLRWKFLNGLIMDWIIVVGYWIELFSGLICIIFSLMLCYTVFQYQLYFFKSIMLLPQKLSDFQNSFTRRSLMLWLLFVKSKKIGVLRDFTFYNWFDLYHKVS